VGLGVYTERDGLVFRSFYKHPEAGRSATAAELGGGREGGWARTVRGTGAGR
jgi:hypothetical protein